MDSHFVSIDVYDVEAKTLTTMSISGPHAVLIAAVLTYSPLFVGAAFLPEEECTALLAEALREQIRPVSTGREKEVRKVIVVEVYDDVEESFDNLPRQLAHTRRERAIENDDFGIKDIQAVDEWSG